MYVANIWAMEEVKMVRIKGQSHAISVKFKTLKYVVNNHLSALKLFFLVCLRVDVVAGEAEAITTCIRKQDVSDQFSANTGFLW